MVLNTPYGLVVLVTGVPQRHARTICPFFEPYISHYVVWIAIFNVLLCYCSANCSHPSHSALTVLMEREIGEDWPGACADIYRHKTFNTTVSSVSVLSELATVYIIV